MIKKALIFAVTAASLATGASAFAQSDYRTDGYERYQGDRRNGQAERQYSAGRDNRYQHRSRDDRDRRSARYERQQRAYRNAHMQQHSSRYYRVTPQVQYGYSTQYSQSPQYGYNTGYGNDQYYRGVPQQQWQRGMHLSSQYRANRYVVNDWRRHQGLYAPRHGQQWVQNGNNYLLVAIASGIIAQVLLGN